MNRECEFVSVWDDGIAISSKAIFNEETGELEEIETANIPGELLNCLEVLQRQFVRVGKEEYEVEENEDGTYSVVRTYEVFFSRNGYARISARSKEEALQIADTELKYDDVSWDDDWHPTDVQLEEQKWLTITVRCAPTIFM